MRRDYFTCVFLALIAGALAFICFEPLYFKYGMVTPREFGLFECVASSFYLVFFLIAVPVYAGYKRKYWIAAGLACYGALAYLPAIFYPAQELIAGKDAGIFHVAVAAVLRGIYGMVNAPFASLSRIWGDKVASSLSYWILPMSLIIPLIIRIYRFYRDAYVQEQLSPADVVASPSNSKFDRKAAVETKEEKKPEVLGTVISAPVKDVRRAEEAPAPAPAPAPVAEPATEPAAESGAEPVIDGSVKETAPEVPPPSGELPGQEPVILLGPPRDYAPEPGQKPAIRQPRFDRSILGEETDGEEAQVPDDRE